MIIARTKTRAMDTATAKLSMHPDAKSGALVGGVYEVVCRRSDGSERWRETCRNLITNGGLDYLLDSALSGGVPITSWYLGLKGTGAPAGADTMASHAGWAEVTDYDEAARQAWTEAGVSSQSITNSASPAVVTISASVTVDGVFLTSSSTKGGTTGTLLSAVQFTAGARAAQDNDTLTITYTISAADDGV